MRSSSKGRWAVVAAAVVLVAVAVAAAVLVRGDGGSEPVSAAGLGLPERVEPSAVAPGLPATGPVGTGVLLFACRECGPTLVLTDGTQYSLAESAGQTTLAFSLSPDGRWLTGPDPEGLAVRELTGDRLHRSAAEPGQALQPWAWSPDSRWLLLGDVRPSETGAPTGYRLLDLDTGTETAVAATPGWDFVSVTPAGRLWRVDLPGRAGGSPLETVTIDLVDPAAPQTAVDTLTVDAGEWLRSGETLSETGDGFQGGIPFRGGPELFPTPDGDGLFLGVFDGASPTGVLRVSAGGRVQERLDTAYPEDSFHIRWIAGQYGGQVLLAESRVMADQPAFSITLSGLTRDGLRELTVLAPAQLVRLAGVAVHGGAAF